MLAMAKSPYILFGEAVVDVLQEPTPRNVRRYLAASHVLEMAGTKGPKRAEAQDASRSVSRVAAFPAT
jgi:hypothetical protein